MRTATRSGRLPLPLRSSPFWLSGAFLGSTNHNELQDDFGTIKIDHQFASARKGFLAVTYSISDGTREVLPPLESSVIDSYTDRKHVISVRHTSILSPTMLNEFIFG